MIEDIQWLFFVGESMVIYESESDTAPLSALLYYSTI